MTIVINGDSKEVDSGITLKELLSSLSLTGKVMAAAVNMEIVKQDEWDSFVLKNTDKLELLDFVGGG